MSHVVLLPLLLFKVALVIPYIFTQSCGEKIQSSYVVMASGGAEELKKPPTSLNIYCYTIMMAEEGWWTKPFQYVGTVPAVEQPFTAGSNRANAVTKSLMMFIAADMRSFSVEFYFFI